MSLVEPKTRTELVAEVVDFIRSRYPSADLIPGSVFRDLLVEAPMQFLADTISVVNLLDQILNLNNLMNLITNTSSQIYYANLFGMDITSFSNILTTIIELYGSNSNMTRTQSTKSSGIVMFYTSTAPTAADIVIPANTIIGIPNTSVTFVTTAAVTIPKNPPANQYWDPINNVWSVYVTAQSVKAGAFTNVPAFTITNVEDTSLNVQVRNMQRFVGGSDTESNRSFLSRIKSAYTGNFQGTAPSILNLIRSFPTVRDCILAYLPGDIYKRRDFINAIDAFVYADNATKVTDAAVLANSAIPYGTGSITGTGRLIPLPDLYTNLIFSLSINNTTPADYFVPTAISFTSLTSGSGGSGVLQTSAVPVYTLSTYTSGESFVTFQDLPISQVGPLPADSTTWTAFAPGPTRKLYLTLGTDSSGIMQYGTFPDFSVGNPISTRITVRKTLAGVSTVDTGWLYGEEGIISTPTYRQFLRKDFIGGTVASASAGQIAIRINPIISDTVKVSYYYNNNISTIAAYLKNPANYFLGQDIAVYTATSVPVFMQLKVQISSSYGTADRASAVRQKLQEIIATYGMGVEINQATLVSEVLKVDGVVDVSIPFMKLGRGSTSTAIPTGTADIVLTPVEYPIIVADNDIQVTAVYTAV